MTDPSTPIEKDDGMIRRLGIFDSTMMMVGIVIGSGIFLLTGIIAKHVPSDGFILLSWVVGGLLTLAGALTFAELGAAMPRAGGQYVYLREAYGHLAGFLFGWVLCLVSMGGAIAAAAAGFAEYFSYFFPALSTQRIIFSITIKDGMVYTLSMGQLVAVAAIALLSTINYIGAGLGKIVQNVFSIVKISTILLFICLGIFFSNGRALQLEFNSGFGNMDIGGLVIGFGLALVAVSWAFDGWHNINYVAGEIKNPKRNLPLTLIWGTLIITALYVLLNVVYIKALEPIQMQGVNRIAEKSAGVLWGTSSAGLISAAILISTFGSLNGAIFVAPRVYYAMAKDNIFFKRAGRLHPRFHTPSFAILIQAVWACFLTLSGSYEQLFTYVTFINIVFWIAGTASVFRLRKKYPHLPRPYKTWGYPVIPILFIVSLLGIMVNTLINRPKESLAGLLLMVLGIPVYFCWRNNVKSER